MILKISFAAVSINSSNVLCASCLFPLPGLHLSLTAIPTDPSHVFMWVPTCSLTLPPPTCSLARLLGLAVAVDGA